MIRWRRNNSTSIRLAVHGAGFVGLLIVALLFVVVVHRPLTRQSADNSARCHQLAALLNQSVRVAAEHDALEKQLAELTSDVEQTHRRIPDVADDGPYLTALAKVAEEEGLQLIDYRRGRATTQPTHSHIELDLKCIGSYDALCRFIQRVEAMPRLSTMSQITLQAVGGRGKYPCEIRLVLYFGLNQPPAIGQQRAAATEVNS